MNQVKAKWQDSVSIVIPAYNEAGRILASLTALRAFCRDRFSGFEIICVDDGSSDNTWEIISGLGDMPFVKPLRLAQNRGKGFAIQQGMQQAAGRFLFFTDADLPYRPEALDAAMNAFYQETCDLVVGARELSDPGRHLPVGQARSIASRVFSGLVARLFKLAVRDTQCGFKGFSRAAARQIFPRLNVWGYAFDVEIFILARRLGLKICRIPVTLVEQTGSKISLTRDPIVMLYDLIRLAIRERRRRIRGQGSGIGCQGPGVRDRVSGTREQGAGVRGQGSGAEG
ncbi:MAG: glycosyltransferase [Desulfobacterales bacterium]|nr:glycosyltransferase [Desulfobacterales bacterium]